MNVEKKNDDGLVS